MIFLIILIFHFLLPWVFFIIHYILMLHRTFIIIILYMSKSMKMAKNREFDWFLDYSGLIEIYFYTRFFTYERLHCILEKSILHCSIKILKMIVCVFIFWHFLELLKTHKCFLGYLSSNPMFPLFLRLPERRS